MSITPGTDNAPDPAPLMTAKEQQEALDLIYTWWKAWDGQGPSYPLQQTESFLGRFVPPETWRRR